MTTQYCVTLDLDDTLWHLLPTMLKAEELQAQWVAKHCPAAAELFTDQAYRQQLYKEALAQDPSLQITLFKLRKLVYERIFISAGVDVAATQDLVARLADKFMEWRNQVHLYEGAVPLLAKLREASVAIGAISNGNADLQAIGIAEYFDFALMAGDVGCCKPDVAIFEQALKLSGVSDTRHICHIGDSVHADIIPAINLNWHCIWVNASQDEWTMDAPLPQQVKELSIASVWPILKQFGIVRS